MDRDLSIIKQMWYHQYDSIPINHSSKRIRIVIDLYTNLDYFFFDLRNVAFADLTIKARNLNKELEFISFNGNLKISLGEISNWPKVYDVDIECENCSDCGDCVDEYSLFSDMPYYYHVKLDIGYTIYHPEFNKYSWGSGYESFTAMQNYFEDEFHLNIPNGLKLDGDSLSIHLFGKTNENSGLETIFFKGSENQINCNKDAIHNRYTLKVDDKRYSDFIKTHNFKKIISLEYKTKNDPFYYLVNAFAFAVFFLNFMTFIIGKPSDTCLIALISFSVLYLALKREGYVFALDVLILFLILGSGFIFILVYLGISWSLLYHYFIDLTTLYSRALFSII
ncbi:MAG: hypothetical protein ACRCVG_00995 [Methanobacteriaceae archaeon]